MSSMLIFIFLTMVFVAICMISLPLLNKEAIKINYIMILAFIFIAVSAPIYYFIGSPQSISLLESESQIDRTIEMLNVRLSEDPEDLDALRALANSYVLKNSLENAFLSFEKIISLENYQNADTLADYGEIMINSGDSSYLSQADRLFERSLQIDGTNAKALFLGGLTAATMEEWSLAVKRWQVLLEQSPPDEIKNTLENKITEWKNLSNTDVEADGYKVNVAVDSNLIASLVDYPDKVLYIIVRDPNNKRPPLAVVREEVKTASVIINNSNAMISGTDLKRFNRLEIVGRISLSGDPLDINDKLSDSVIIDSTVKSISLKIK
jgi:tetratricopeptide (TPR) repeat protein